MARLPYVDPATAPEAVRDSLAAVPPLNIMRMLAHAETAFDPILRLGGAVLTALELDPRLRELAVLQVAKDCDCEYEWVQHESVGKAVGLTDEQIAAVRSGSVDDLGDLERAVVRFTSEVVLGTRVSDETFAAVHERLSPREIVELLITIGDYLMVARLMTTLELEMDDAAPGLSVADATGAILRR